MGISRKSPPRPEKPPQEVAKDNAHLAKEIVLARQNREELKKKARIEAFRADA